MSFINSTLYSNVLRQDIHLDLFIPNDVPELGIKPSEGIIYFLHGLGSSEKQFREYTRTNRYARENQLTVVYVSAPKSYYNDMKYGMPYYTYITEELPRLLKSMYGISFPREKTFIAGLSMGGYGAWRIGLSRPDIFGACASLSGACDLRYMASEIKKRKKLGPDEDTMFPVFGDDINIPDERDLYWLTRKVSEMPKEEQPRLFLCSGNQDDLFDLHNQALRLRDYVRNLDIKDFVYLQWDGGHDYNFWDRAMVHTIAFFLNNDYDIKKLSQWSCPATQI